MDKRAFGSGIFPVLIETYWNVNRIRTMSFSKIFFRINRNILECKWGRTGERARSGVVLIETYWNVNVNDVFVSIVNNGVLIETYWNVNVSQSFYHVFSPRINRNILECKSIWIVSVSVPVFSINRNILECKLRSIRISAENWIRY